MEVELANKTREIGMTTFDAQTFMRMATNRVVDRGIADFTAKRHNELQAELHEGRVHQEGREADALRFKDEYKTLMNELIAERVKAESSVALNPQHDEVEAAEIRQESLQG
eukprot:s1724_g7.t1